MNRKAAGMVFTLSAAVAMLAGDANAQNSPASAALDTSLRGAVESKDVPGVVALITDRERAPANIRRAVSHRFDDQAGHFGGIDATHRAGPPWSR